MAVGDLSLVGVKVGVMDAVGVPVRAGERLPVGVGVLVEVRAFKAVGGGRP